MTNTPSTDPMRLRRVKRRASLLTLPIFSLGLVAVPLTASHAADTNGTWTLLSSGNASGTWSDAATGNWSGGTVADGSGFTANFSTLDITATSTVSLGSSRTIGGLIFGDTTIATNAAVGWILDNGGSAANILTLAGTTPTITVNELGSNGTGSNKVFGTVNISAKIAGTNGLTKAGAGNLVLSGTNTYTGGTHIKEGTLLLSAAGALTALTDGTGAVTIDSGATLKVTAASSYTLNNPLSGSGTLHLNSLNLTTTISNDNSAYSGQVKIERMTLAVGHDGALGTGSILLGVNDQASGIRSTDTTTRTLANAFALTGTANSSYNFGSSTTASANGNLSFTDTTAIALGNITKKFQVHNRTQFDAAFAGTGGITMQNGTGTLVLNGANTYTGVTTINAGALLVNGSLATGTVVTVNTNGALGGSGIIGGATTISGTLSPGDGTGAPNSDATALLTFGSGLTLTSTAKTLLDIAQADYDSIDVTGALTYGGALTVTLDNVTPSFGQSWQLFSFGSQSGTLASLTVVGGGPFTATDSGFTGQIGGIDYTFSYTDGTLASAIPEPSTYAAIAGALALGAVLIRRRRAQAPA